uniref:Late endosomal/lysosomal adaptor and MAPK and MTOR activator 5 n=1 Tax=Peronospora matthiolae TaxID=2874970 RepID=A0AAV1VGZ4_9STRA
MITTAESRGLVLNDGHGLLLKAQGDLAYTTRDQKNGFFTCIAEKAIDLGQVADGNDDSDAVEDAVQCVPIVRLETNRRALVIAKFETDGHERTLVVSKSSPAVETALE